MKRFYENVDTMAEAGGYAVRLDGRGIKTPGKRALILPTEPMAQAIAGEWAAQTDTIDPNAMPLMRLAGTAIDGTADRRNAVVDSIVAYGQTDLTCYRVMIPRDLSLRQAESWQPMLDWLAEAHDVHLVATDGVMPIRQSDDATAALRRAVDKGDAFQLTALHAATTALGSVVLALALRDGAADPEGAWAAAQLDESYQNEKWGEDEEALDRRAAVRAELDAAARMLALAAPAGL